MTSFLRSADAVQPRVQMLYRNVLAALIDHVKKWSLLTRGNSPSYAARIELKDQKTKTEKTGDTFLIPGISNLAAEYGGGIEVRNMSKDLGPCTAAGALNRQGISQAAAGSGECRRASSPNAFLYLDFPIRTGRAA